MAKTSLAMAMRIWLAIDEETSWWGYLVPWVKSPRWREMTGSESAKTAILARPG